MKRMTASVMQLENKLVMSEDENTILQMPMRSS